MSFSNSLTKSIIMRIASLSLLILLISYKLFSDISGKIIDKDDSTPIELAKIGLISLPDSLVVGSGESNSEGNFRLATDYAGRAYLSVRFPGYMSPDTVLNLSGNLNIGILRLTKIDSEVDEILVNAEAASGQQIGDTVQFNSAAFKTNPDADANDLVKKLPGVSDDGTGLKAQGEEVKRVLVDGKEFFGNDPNAALKNIPAEAVQNVQIYDRNSDNAEFTGVDDGESEKTINLKLKEEYKSGAFGNIGAGYGTDDRYGANGSVNYFNNAMRLSFLGNLNNINRQNFTSEDLSGVSSGGGGGGGRRRYRYSNESQFLVGGQEGITSTGAFGINYIDEWTKDSEISLSYLFSQNDNERLTDQNIEYIGPDVNGDEFNNNQISLSDNLNNRLTGRMKFPIDTNNTILFIPRFRWQNRESDFNQDGFFVSDNGGANQFTENTNDSESDNISFEGTLMLQHKFAKPGRTIQIDLQTEIDDNTSFNNFQNNFGSSPEIFLRQDIQSQDIKSNSQKYEVEIDYTEPFIWEDFLLTFEANTEIENSDISQLTFDNTNENQIILTQQSSDLNVQYNRYGWETGFRYGKENYTVSITGEYRRIDMENQFTLPTENLLERTFEAFTPRVFFRYNFGNNNIRLFARRRNGLPSANQLNDAIDNSNPLSISQGNRNLDQEMDNYIWANYNYFNPESSFNFYTQLNGSITENTIGNNSRIFARDTTIGDNIAVGAGSQYFTYQNLDESFFVGLSSGMGKKIDFLSSNLNLSLNLNYSEIPTIINGANNISTNNSIGTGLSIVSNISEDIDFNIRYSPTYTLTNNSLGTIEENDFWRNTISGNFNFQFWDGFVLRTDINFTDISGLGDNFDQQFTIWNGSIGYKFLENDAAEISLYAYDILRQNQSINRNITANQITDESNNVLTQFLMLNFNYRIRNTMSNRGGRPPRGRWGR